MIIDEALILDETVGKPNPDKYRNRGGDTPMSEALSSGTIRRIAVLFPAAQRAEVGSLLVAECGSTLPFADTLGAAGIERVRFAVLKTSGGSLERLRAAVTSAQQDWRDVLVWAGFGDDPQAHLKWLVDAEP
jgi:hypothetical protein